MRWDLNYLSISQTLYQIEIWRLCQHLELLTMFLKPFLAVERVSMGTLTGLELHSPVHSKAVMNCVS